MSEITIADLAAQIAVLTKAVLTNKPTLDISEAAAYTGMTQSYLYKLTSTQQIPHYKPRGKMLYFDRAELDKWLKQNRVSTAAETETQAANHLVKHLKN